MAEQQTSPCVTMTLKFKSYYSTTIQCLHDICIILGVKNGSTMPPTVFKLKGSIFESVNVTYTYTENEIQKAYETYQELQKSLLDSLHLLILTALPVDKNNMCSTVVCQIVNGVSVAYVILHESYCIFTAQNFSGMLISQVPT